jgi:hypothetical protein
MDNEAPSVKRGLLGRPRCWANFEREVIDQRALRCRAPHVPTFLAMPGHDKPEMIPKWSSQRDYSQKAAPWIAPRPPDAPKQWSFGGEILGGGQELPGTVG